MPTDLPRFRRNVALTGLRRLEQIEARALWIGHDRETADGGNVGGWGIDLAAQTSHLGGGAVDVVDFDVARPARSHPRVGRVLGQRHHSADLRVAGAEQRVGHAGHGHVLRFPPNHFGIERLCRRDRRCSSTHTKRRNFACRP